MNINIKATKIKLTPEIKGCIQEKMGKLDKYLGKIAVTNADFEVGITTAHHHKGKIYRAEANLTLAGDFIRVDKTEKDLYKAIDKVKDHLEEIIIKHKERLIDKKRRAS